VLRYASEDYRRNTVGTRVTLSLLNNFNKKFGILQSDYRPQSSVLSARKSSMMAYLTYNRIVQGWPTQQHPAISLASSMLLWKSAASIRKFNRPVWPWPLTLLLEMGLLTTSARDNTFYHFPFPCSQSKIDLSIDRHEKFGSNPSALILEHKRTQQPVIVRFANRKSREAVYSARRTLRSSMHKSKSTTCVYQRTFDTEYQQDFWKSPSPRAKPCTSYYRLGHTMAK